MYEKDSFTISLLWGRVGAAVLGLAAFVLGIWGYSLSAEEQSNAVELIAGLIAGAGGILALVSKVRESKKVNKTDE